MRIVLAMRADFTSTTEADLDTALDQLTELLRSNDISGLTVKNIGVIRDRRGGGQPLLSWISREEGDIAFTIFVARESRGPDAILELDTVLGEGRRRLHQLIMT